MRFLRNNQYRHQCAYSSRQINEIIYAKCGRKGELKNED
jgi:hypothetical protein